jgi:hypothetical protein
MNFVAAEAQGRRIGAGGANQQRGQSKGRKQKRKEESPDPEDETRPMLCPNCKEMIQAREMAAHTVACYRNSTKCRICGEIIQKDRKKEHIIKFRDYKRL